MARKKKEYKQRFPDLRLAGVEYLPIDDLTPDEGNVREHSKESINAIKISICDGGMDDPIGIWGENNLIVEGHGRLQACKELGMAEVPVIRLDHLDEEGRKAYAIRHNATTDISEFDPAGLAELVKSLPNYDFSEFDLGIVEAAENGPTENPYTRANSAPQYEPTGEHVELSELCDISKMQALVEEIDGADITNAEKDFLRLAAQRHLSFSYKKIAEYYAQASPEMQRLMERSAVVIIDINDAVRNGFVRLLGDIHEMLEEDEDDEE